MKTLQLSIFSYLLFIAFIFMQTGASLFATTVNVATLIKEPPRSLSMLQGEFVFNPDVFWNNFPNYTFIVFVVAMVLCWKTKLRKWLFIGFLIWVASALEAIFLLGPAQSEFLSTPYADTIDLSLKQLGNLWHTYSVLFICISALSGLVMIYGLIKNLDFSVTRTPTDQLKGKTLSSRVFI